GARRRARPPGHPRLARGLRSAPRPDPRAAPADAGPPDHPLARRVRGAPALDHLPEGDGSGGRGLLPGGRSCVGRAGPGTGAAPLDARPIRFPRTDRSTEEGHMMSVIPLDEQDLDAAMPLIAGYQRFYGVADPDDERNRKFFRRFLAPSQDGLLLGAWEDGEL